MINDDCQPIAWCLYTCLYALMPIYTNCLYTKLLSTLSLDPYSDIGIDQHIPISSLKINSLFISSAEVRDMNLVGHVFKSSDILYELDLYVIKSCKLLQASQNI